jgi:DNA-binding XRE family transcriptional regulator
MTNGQITKLREKLGLDRHEMARFLGLTSYQSMMNIENDVRKPSRLARKVMLYVNSLSKKEALSFIEELNRHEPK